MPTVVEKTIGSGKDYATIQAWINAAPASLVSSDQIWKGLLYTEGGGTNGEWSGGGRMGSFDGAAKVTSSTCYFWLTTASGQSFADNAGKLTNALRYNTASGVAIRSSGSNVFEAYSGAVVRLTGLQLKGSGAHAALEGYNSSGRFYVENCVVDCGGAVAISAPAFLIVNSVAYGSSVVLASATNGSSYTVSSSTFYTTATSGSVYDANNNSGTVKSSGFFGGATAIANASWLTASYNATNLSSVGAGSNNQVSLTTSAQFQSISAGSEDFRSVSSGLLDENGLRDQTNTSDLDIVGSARSTTAPTIGAWEVSTGPAAPTGVTVGSITPTGATVSWTDASTNETGFKVQTAPSPYTTWTTAAGSPTAANATSLAVTGLLDGTAYKARVAATNASGDSAYVESGIFTTLALTRVRPSSTISAGSWTAVGAASIHAAVNEATASDSEYITTSVSSTSKVKITTVSNPGTTSFHSFQFRAKGDGTTQLKVDLVQGDPTETLIKSTTITPTTSFALYTVSLTSGEASAVTDYSALYFKFVGL